MAVDLFLKLSEGIDGESLGKNHSDEIDILAWSWGMSQSGTTHMGKGGTAGKANFQDISFTKYVDKSSAKLMQYLSTGKKIDTATFVAQKASGDTPIKYIEIELTEVIVSSLSTGGSGGEDRFTENVTLNFRKFHYTYKVQDAEQAEQTGGEFTFDIAENAAA